MGFGFISAELDKDNPPLSLTIFFLLRDFAFFLKECRGRKGLIVLQRSSRVLFVAHQVSCQPTPDLSCFSHFSSPWPFGRVLLLGSRLLWDHALFRYEWYLKRGHYSSNSSGFRKSNMKTETKLHKQHSIRTRMLPTFHWNNTPVEPDGSLASYSSLETQ